MNFMKSIFSKLFIIIILISMQGCSWIISFSIYGKICSCTNSDYSEYSFEVFDYDKKNGELFTDVHRYDTLTIDENGYYNLKFKIVSQHDINLRLKKKDSVVDVYNFHDNVVPIMLWSRVLEVRNEKRNSIRIFEDEKLDSIRDIEPPYYTLTNIHF